MRIALDLSGVAEQTGVRIYALQLLNELQKLDRENKFYVVMRHIDADIYPINAENFRPVFMPKAVESTLSNIAWHWTAFSRLLNALRIDVLHQMDCNRISIIRDQAHVVTVHGLIDNRVPGRRLFFRQQYNTFMVPRLIPLVTKIISVSNNTRKDLLKFTRVPDNKIHVIHEGCALSGAGSITSSAAASILKQKYGLENDYILYVARLEHPNKNHVSLLKAYELLCRQNDNIPMLVLVGGDSYRAEVVKQAVNSLNLSDRVKLTGFVPDEDLPAFYKCASLYICPTLYEGFGLPLLEAMQFGVPLVCSDSSSLPEVFGNAAVKIDPRSVSSISNGMMKVLSSGTLRQTLIQEGYNQVAKFSSREMANKTSEVYFEAFRQKHLNKTKLRDADMLI